CDQYVFRNLALRSERRRLGQPGKRVPKHARDERAEQATEAGNLGIELAAPDDSRAAVDRLEKYFTAMGLYRHRAPDDSIRHTPRGSNVSPSSYPPFRPGLEKTRTQPTPFGGGVPSRSSATLPSPAPWLHDTWSV